MSGAKITVDAMSGCKSKKYIKEMDKYFIDNWTFKISLNTIIHLNLNTIFH